MGSNKRMKSIFDKFGFEFINREEHFYDMHDRWEDKLNYILRNPEATVLTKEDDNMGEKNERVDIK